MKISSVFFWLILGAITAVTVQVFFAHPYLSRAAGPLVFVLFLMLGGIDVIASFINRPTSNNT